MRVEFSKMSGAGNDFVVLGPEYSSLESRAPALARKLCPRRTSVGADGLIVVDVSHGFFMHYYNGDGSEASFCGNGARCFVLYCMLKSLARGEMEFGTRSGLHRGAVVAGGVRVSMPPPRLERELAVEVGGGTYAVHLVRAGVPHAVIILEHGRTPDVETVGRAIRSHRAFGEEGANVDFVTTTADGEFSIRTYERGVEQETLACGSGSVAAAYVLRLKGLAADEATLRVASGDRLGVRLSRGQGEYAYLAGPAALVFEGILDLDLEGLEPRGAKEQAHV
jgi:diaminopimelate epimerase